MTPSAAHRMVPRVKAIRTQSKAKARPAAKVVPKPSRKVGHKARRSSKEEVEGTEARAPRIVSLFTGAGGLDYGLEAAGYHTVVAIERDADCCASLRSSRPNWHVIESDIFDVSTEKILKQAKVGKEDVDLVVGGPPCQPFSKSGYWLRRDSKRLSDPRASTLVGYLRLVAQIKPRAFLFENVEGFAYRDKDEALDFVLGAINEINGELGTNYKPSFQVMNAADYGVPQVRRRFFLVAARDGTNFEFPSRTHGDGLLPPRTAWDAIGDLDQGADESLAPKGYWTGLLPSIPEGENYLFHTDRGGGRPLFGWRRRYWSFLLKLAKNRPAWTIQASPGPATGPFHWTSRLLSIRELCRIQTFPDDAQVVGARGACQRQIGNAVPSLLAEIIGRAIRTQLLHLPEIPGELRLLPPRRCPLPQAEQVQPVPNFYSIHEGEHEPHPGEGRGPGGKSRAVRDTGAGRAAGRTPAP